MNARQVRLLTVAALPLVAGGWLPAASAEGPQYNYFDAGYQWIDTNNAVRMDSGQHEGIKLNASLGLAEFGPVGLHLFGEYFDGDYSGSADGCGDRDSQSYVAGLGAHYRLTPTTHLVANVGYVDSEMDVVSDTDSCAKTSVSDDGYEVEGLIRSSLSENIELEAGYRYTDLSDSDIDNRDAIIGLGYLVNDRLTLRVRGVVFDDDTGIELSVRFNFASLLGRDYLF
ncbi:MAG: outer membrane beta-barrel protein [Gammaproteobacteria bacterium]|nr:outer membrane beta-barrel protein [Gammaproteobacteria bacterium]